MFIGTNWRIAFAFCTILVGSQWLTAQNPVYKPGEYPAPRYPQVKASYTVEELLPIAREVIRRPVMSAFLKAGYSIQPGQRALIVVPSRFNNLVLETIVRAIQEAGGQADVVRTYGPLREAGDLPIRNAAREAGRLIEPVPVDENGNPIRRSRGFAQQGNIIRMAETGGYDILIYRSGGPHGPIAIPWQYIFWDQIDKFVTAASFPDELQQAIDKAAWDILLQSRRIHVTDPEGTDIAWTIDPRYWEEAKETYQFNIVHEGHLSAIPLGMAVDSFMESDAAGVIAGTLNHAGPFPHIQVGVSKASAAGIEGGGEYGRLWRQVLAKWKDVQWPGHPGPGLNKLWEVAVGTNVKGIRPKSFAEEGGSWERSRAGVIHWGIGARSGFVMDIQLPNEYKEFRKQHHAPGGHAHVHTYFSTMEIETASGQQLQLINKGHLTVLDDPQVRQVAAKYGDPDELLREIWIPSMPGINVPGDYREEYGSDPVSYIQKEIAEKYNY
ncbi:MAG: hypothetical protein V3T65_03130 [Acidobacteriota bacterium]